MKDDSSFKYLLVVVALGLCFFLVRSFFNDRSSDYKANKSLASSYGASNEESADYYRGYADAIEAIRADPELLSGSNAYDEIWHAGFEFGYDEGSNGVEY